MNQNIQLFFSLDYVSILPKEGVISEFTATIKKLTTSDNNHVIHIYLTDKLGKETFICSYSLRLNEILCAEQITVKQEKTEFGRTKQVELVEKVKQ